MTTAASFKKADVKRALAAAAAAGLKVAAVRFPPEGGFAIVTTDLPEGTANEWDEVLGDEAAPSA